MKKLGLCLSGGGAKGPYEIGVLQALQELGIFSQIDAISGASIGAVNAVFSATTPLEKVKYIWTHIPKNPLPREKSLVERERSGQLKYMERGIYTLQRLDEILLDNIDFEKPLEKDVFISVSESGEKNTGFIELFRSYVNHYVLHNSRSHYVNLKDVDQQMARDVIEASCSIPIVFPPRVINDKKYYDGGVFDNTPVQPLIDSGCDEIIVIDIGFTINRKNYQKLYPDTSFHVLISKKDLGDTLDFTDQHSEEIYQYGYEEGLEFFKDFKVDKEPL